MFPLIDKQPDLLRVCEALANADSVAVDTEFVRDRTYYPRLCLLQLAFDQQLVLVDPLADIDLAPLFAALQRPELVKVLHAARQDLEIFYLLGNFVPQPVFDTQMAAACLGMGEQLSYTNLVAGELEVALGKSHARTDWQRRPLSEAQLRYAADDVEYLLKLYKNLGARLASSGRDNWLADSFRQLASSELYEIRPAEAWRRIRPARKLKGKRRTRIKRLAAWREQLAMEKDLPRRWVIADQPLLELAAHDGSDIRALAKVPGVPERLIRQQSQQLCDLLNVGDSECRDEANPDRQTSGKEQRKLKMLAELVRVRAEEIGTSPALLATRSELKAFLREPDNSSLLAGWRREEIGEKLLAAMAAERA